MDFLFRTISNSLENIIEHIFSTFSTLSAGTRARLLNTHGHFKGLMPFLFLRPAYDQLDRMEDHVL